MQTNYYFLQKLSKKLNSILTGHILVECFCQEKNELIFVFQSNGKNIESNFFIKASISPSFACLSFPSDFKRANQNSVNIFEELIGSKVSFIRQHLNERAFTIYFNNNYLLTFKLFGNKSNILLFKNEILIDLFHSNIKSDKLIAFKELDRQIDQSFEGFSRNNFSITHTFPTLGKALMDEIQTELLKNNIINRSDEWNYIDSFLKQLYDSNDFYIISQSVIPVLSLWPATEVLSRFSDPIEALNAFYIAYTRVDVFEKEKALAIINLEKQLAKLQYGKTMLLKKYDELQYGVKNEEIANILMANMHAIPTGIMIIELTDFYRNTPIFIKLKKELTAQKNAENYYRKAKNEKTELLFIKKSIEDKETKIEECNQKLIRFKAIADLRALRNTQKTDNKNGLSEKLAEEFPFKTEIVDGWEIWIGRNAINNDLLTQKYAKKDDLWFHARDVAGSHVIIRQQSGKNYPKHVIERAAQLAAFNSKRKNDTLCPVIMTPKKYVRKAKNMAAGKVIVDKEEVLLVEPRG